MYMHQINEDKIQIIIYTRLPKIESTKGKYNIECIHTMCSIYRKYAAHTVSHIHIYMHTKLYIYIYKCNIPTVVDKPS